MNPGTVQAALAENDASGRFYAGAYRRMNWCMVAAGAVAAPLIFWAAGAKLGAGFLLGAGIAFLNLYWLRRLVNRFAGLVTRAPEKPRTGRMVAIFVLRYALIGLGAYVIFLDSLPVLYGFFAGLLLPVIGVFGEAVAEIAYAVRSR